MQTVQESTIDKKTKELCQALVDDPQMQSIRQRIETFMQDDSARGQYDSIVSKGQALQDKQKNAQALSSEEIAEFEQGRDALLGNTVARGFLDAQEELQQVRDSIQKLVTRTLELGRVPSEEDLGSCCDSGCGCGHGH